MNLFEQLKPERLLEILQSSEIITDEENYS